MAPRWDESCAYLFRNEHLDPCSNTRARSIRPRSDYIKAVQHSIIDITVVKAARQFARLRDIPANLIGCVLIHDKVKY